jgi:hypothetical protein
MGSADLVDGKSKVIEAELVDRDDEQAAGRRDVADSTAERRTSGRTARDSTGVNPSAVESVTGGPEMPPA